MPVYQRARSPSRNACVKSTAWRLTTKRKERRCKRIFAALHSLSHNGTWACQLSCQFKINLLGFLRLDGFSLDKTSARGATFLGHRWVDADGV